MSAGRLALWVVNSAVCVFLLAPIIVVLITAFSADAYLVFPPTGFSLRWFEAFLGNEEFVGSVALSIQLGLIATAVACVVGLMASLALATAQFPGAGLIRAAILSPLIVPAVVLGLAMLIFFNRLGFGGSLMVLVFAHTIIIMPYVVRIISAGLQSYDRSIDLAAQSLGANPLIVLATVTLPLIKGSLVAAAIFAFITSFDEVTTTLFLVAPQTTTLPVRVFQYIQYSSNPLVAAVSAIEVVLTVVVVLIIERAVGFTRFLR
jgi:putative spermidine/putrescine transport system permease protein